MFEVGAKVVVVADDFRPGLRGRVTEVIEFRNWKEYVVLLETGKHAMFYEEELRLDKR